MGVYSKPVFTTERLRVFKVTIVPDPRQQHMQRDFFFACRTDIDCPMVVVSATCWKLPAQSALGECVHVELIETSALHRRCGLARELWLAVEKFYGLELHGTPTTEDGEKFMSALEAAENAAAG
jgi:hypothetical protein